MTDGAASTPRKFFEIANEFEFTFNWAYASRTATAYFTSGRLPLRAAGLDRRLPTLGTGAYEWRGFLHPRRASRERQRSRRPAAELEQPIGAGLHARRRRAVRVGAPGRAVRQVPAPRRAGRRRRRDEPRRDRGRAFARVAGREPGAARRRPRRTRRPRRRSTCSTSGCSATRRASTPTATGRTTTPARRSWTRSGGRSRKP